MRAAQRRLVAHGGYSPCTSDPTPPSTLEKRIRRHIGGLLPGARSLQPQNFRAQRLDALGQFVDRKRVERLADDMRRDGTGFSSMSSAISRLPACFNCARALEQKLC